MRDALRKVAVVLSSAVLLAGSLTLWDWSTVSAQPAGSPWHSGRGKKKGHIESVSSCNQCPSPAGCDFSACSPFDCSYLCINPDGTYSNVRLPKTNRAAPERAGDGNRLL